MNKKVEILAPAGSYESLVAAINAGADAVYLGGRLYGARAYADNFGEEELIEGIKYAHLYGVKIYLTINTLFKDEEIEALYEYLLPYYRAGLDAVIVQDLGVLKFVRSHFPELEIHASTQMSQTGKYGAKLLKDMGATRVVTAREISLSEIRDISENVDIEIESFVHGAMCYCYSGQCLLSSFIGGRSGNRGRCAQACRLPYTVGKDTAYYMSLKDMCTLEIIPDIIDAGVFSLKIEGRMKSSSYTALVVATYRKYVDMYIKNGREGYKVNEEDVRNLMDLYNRGSFTQGYYNMHNSKKMMAMLRPNHQGVLVGTVMKKRGGEVTVKLVEDVNSKDILDVKDTFDYTLKEGNEKGRIITLRVSKECKLKEGDEIYRTRNNKLLDEVSKDFIQNNRKIEIKGQFVANVGCNAYLTVYLGENMATVASEEVVLGAKNKPVDEETIRKQLAKTGGTNFEFVELEVAVDENIFISLKSINELRRNALLELTKNVSESFEKNQHIEKICKESNYENNKTESKLTILLDDDTRIENVLKYEEVKRVYVEMAGINRNIEDLVSEAHKNSKELYVALPYIFRSKSVRYFEENMADKQVDGYLVRNLEEYQYIKANNIQGNVIFDYNVYQFNKWGQDVLVNDLQGETTCSVELNFTQLKEIGANNSELIVYGYLPMMISSQCFVMNTSGCTAKPGLTSVSDRCNNKFFVKNDCTNCYNIIYNATPLVLCDKVSEIENVSPQSIRVMIGAMDMDNVDEIIKSVLEGKNSFGQITRGHFLRGVM